MIFKIFKFQINELMKKINLILSAIFLGICCFTTPANAQTGGYSFKLEKKLEATPVKNQQNTGTCWSFSTTSFVESELMRLGQGTHDLSEMFTVRQIYLEKALNYMRRQGKAQFSEGSLSHDVMNVVRKYGALPQSAFDGLNNGDKEYDHAELEAVLQGMLDGMMSTKANLSNHWKQSVEAVLDVYLGEVPENFQHNGKSYTAKTFADEVLKINPDDYVELTSYEHHPFYKICVLEIPDNFSNGFYYNVPIEDLETITDNAVTLGYSVAWDCDVSETGFSQKNGLAILPDKSWNSMTKDEKDAAFKSPVPQQKVTQAMRQTTFDNYSTTDDHLMHITGIAKDSQGNRYYQVKNSWGAQGEYDGYLYASKAYFQLKTVAVMVRKEAIPKQIKEKLGL
jgi:bleomycin hydrolase